MSYIRYGHDLCWFDDKSDLYVYNNGNGIEDYGGSNHLPSVIESVGRMIYCETKDFDYATLMVIQLAYECGCFNKLRFDLVTVHLNTEDFMKETVINNYVKSIRKMLPIYLHRKNHDRN